MISCCHCLKTNPLLLLMLHLQQIVGQNYLLSYLRERSRDTYTHDKGDDNNNKNCIGTSLFRIQRIPTDLVMAATKMLLGSFFSVRNLSNQNGLFDQTSRQV